MVAWTLNDYSAQGQTGQFKPCGGHRLVDAHAYRPSALPPGGELGPACLQIDEAPDSPQGPRILLLAQPGDACTRYEAAVGRTGSVVDTVASLDTFYDAVTHFAYNGIVIDIPTKIKALSDHKDLVNSILGRFPVIQVNIDRQNGQVRALLYGCHQQQGSLEELIREVCWLSPARKLRSEVRYPVHFNVLLSTTSQFDPVTLIRTVTMDVSSKGCFLFSAARFQVGGRVWLQLVDLYDKTPIIGIVRHKRRWGDAMAVPGIGIKFETISENQRAALLRAAQPSRLLVDPSSRTCKGAP